MPQNQYVVKKNKKIYKKNHKIFGYYKITLYFCDVKIYQT